MARTFSMYIAPCSLSLVVPLRNVPELPWKRLRRILPGLLRAQLPMNLDECSYAFARNGKSVVGLVFQKRRDEAFLQNGTAAEGVVLGGWALWRKALRMRAPQSDAEKRALLWLGNETHGPVMVTGQGETMETTTKFSGAPEEAQRILRMAFGTKTEGAVCLCYGTRAAEFAETLKQGELKVQPLVAESSENSLLDACAELFLDEPESVIPTPVGEAKRAAKLSRACSLLGLGLMLFSGVFVYSAFQLDGKGEENGRALDREQAIRVDSVAGYPVAARGDRAIALAKEAAVNRETTVLDRLLKAGASARLAEAMGVLSKADGVVLSTLRVDAETIIVSGMASESAALASFEEAFRGENMEVQMERLPPEQELGDRVRFNLTARRASR